METASFSIPPAEELNKLNDEHFETATQGIADALFYLKPDPNEVRDTLARFFRYLADRGGAAAAHTFITQYMGKYTLTDGQHFSEENERYLTALSEALHSHPDYQHTFVLIADAINNGEIERPKLAEIPKPAD